MIRMKFPKNSSHGLALNAALAFGSAVVPARAQLVDKFAGPLDGWNVLQDEYVDAPYLDGFSLEWDYFMIHDDDFTGVVGMVLADPRGRLGEPEPDDPIQLDLMPSGGSVAFAGQFADAHRVSNYVAFGLRNTTAGKDERSMTAARDGMEATIEPTMTGDALRLTGRTRDAEWDLEVSQDWAERGGFEPVTGRDVGAIPGEFWTVNMVWPRTRVVGTVTRADTGEVLAIDGHGYRENSFGRWAFVLDGWDFAIASDDDAGVQWAWQSYHKSEALDFLDVSFYDNGKLKKVSMTGGDLGWRHDALWRYDLDARQCAPRNAWVVADDGRYRIEASVDIGEDQIPLMSNASMLTGVYVIMEWFPHVTGTIKNLLTGEIVASFAARGGGEISYPKSILPFGNWLGCTVWGRLTHNKPMP